MKLRVNCCVVGALFVQLRSRRKGIAWDEQVFAECTAPTITDMNLVVLK